MKNKAESGISREDKPEIERVRDRTTWIKSYSFHPENRTDE